MALDPNCQPARFTMAYVYFLRFQKGFFLKEAEQALQLNPNRVFYVASLSWQIAMVGEWERGLKLMDKAMRMNLHHPG